MKKLILALAICSTVAHAGWVELKGEEAKAVRRSVVEGIRANATMLCEALTHTTGKKDTLKGTDMANYLASESRPFAVYVEDTNAQPIIAFTWTHATEGNVDIVVTTTEDQRSIIKVGYEWNKVTYTEVNTGTVVNPRWERVETKIPQQTATCQ